MCTGLPFIIYTDSRALNNLQKIDLPNIAAARTLRSLEVILSKNVEIKRIKGADKGIVDYLSRIRQKTEEIPSWPKFESIFKGSTSDTGTSQGVNSIRKIKAIGNMREWPKDT